MTLRRRSLMQSTIALTTFSICGRAVAQTPLFERATILVGFPAGGGTDGAARRVADGLRGDFARLVVVENKPGASGQLAVAELLRGARDGSVMIMQPDAVMLNRPQVDPKNTKYKLDDLTPVVSVGLHDHALAVGPMVPESVRSVKDFLEWAKANPKLASFGTPGTNSSQDFLMKTAMKDNSFELVHVPYKGSAPGMQDLLGGQLAAMVSPVGDSLQYLASGKIRILGTTGLKRSAFTPNVPTFAEQGFKGMELTERMGLWVAREVPENVQDQLYGAVRKIVSQPAVVEHLAKIGFEEDPISRRGFKESALAGYKAWGERIQKTGYKPED